MKKYTIDLCHNNNNFMEYWIKHSRYKIGFLPDDGFGAVEGFAGQDNSLEMESSRLGGLTAASVANVDFFGADIMDNCLVMIHKQKVRYFKRYKRNCASHR